MDGNVCLVTGGGGGIGREVCALLAGAGASVYLIDLPAAAAAGATTLAEVGLKVEAVGLDVTSRDEVDAFIFSTARSKGRIDALFCLAGVVRNAKLPAVTPEDFDLTMSTHATGTLNFVRAVVPPMKERGYGRIVVTSSVAALGTVGGTSYAAAKGAIEGMMRSAAIELASHGITVNCVAPGIVDVGLYRQQPEKQRNHMLDRTPMRRAGEPREIAECYRFLGSREASFITGQTLYVCGGASIGAFV
ncbi:MAG: SDR family oxidoreductase [Rhizobiaceae bacterium]